MSSQVRYGIEPGQVYARVDGAPGRLIVRDVMTFAEAGDVVVYDETQDEERRIDAFKLARVQYYLVDFDSGDTRRELLKALLDGQASPRQQRRVLQLFHALQSTLGEQTAHARRGRFAVDQGEWRRYEDERDGTRTWLCVRVADNADLSCKGTRASALDKAIELEKSHDAN
jgi:hypothetical protein